MPVRYDTLDKPSTDDPCELAVIDAMFGAYMDTAFPPDYRYRNPPHFWQMAHFIHLPEMARAAIAAMRETKPAQLTLSFPARHPDPNE